MVNKKSLWVLIVLANIIHLRLKMEDSAIISRSLFLIICMTLPRMPLASRLIKTAVFIMNIKM
jgi:hypothetical protein